MKGQISRPTFDPVKRFSGVRLQMGRMVTEADVNERDEIGAARTQALGEDAIRSGVPAAGGAVALAGATPALREGDVYADGLRGELRASAAVPAGDPLALYDVQADFPRPPPRVGPALVYADLWERAIFANEETDLVDPAFHGADTCFRTRTMTQIRLAPVGTVLGQGAFPRKGNARLTAELRAEPETPDPCDPCATEFDLPIRTGDFLFRLEVMHVTGPANAATGVRLLWSAENASERHTTAVAIPSDFKRNDRLYEFFSAVSESHQGVFADPATRVRSQVTVGFPAAIPARTDGSAGDWPFVRRWDGGVDLNLTTGTATAVLLGPGEAVALAAGVVTITTAHLRLELQIATRSVVVGDHWFVVVREFADENDRVRVVSAEPYGILHHYVPLFQINAAGAPLPVSDADRRRLSFPALSNLPSTHVGFVDNCTKLYSGAQNVQAALDALCAIAAEDIAFTDNCAKLYAGATTVQAALDALCAVAAEDIAFTNTCERLYGSGDTGAKTVQQALDKLCETVPEGGGACCTVTVGKKGEYPDIVSALKKLVKDGEPVDICLCLLAEDHAVELVLGKPGEPKPVRLEIKGCGRGQTRLKVAAKGLQLGIRSIVVSNIDIAVDDGSVGIGLSAPIVQLTDVSLRGISRDNKPLLILDASDRLDVVRCDFEALREQPFDRVIGAVTAVGLEPRETAFDLSSATTDRAGLMATRRASADKLAGRTDASRRAGVRKLATFVRDNAATLTDGEKAAIDRLGASITAADGKAIDKALNDLRVTALKSLDGLALVLADRGDTSLADCRVDGLIGLYGVPGKDLAVDELKKLTEGGMNAVTFKSEGKLSIRNCILVGITLDATTLDRLKMAAQGNNVDIDAFSTIHLLGNDFPAALQRPLIAIAGADIKITDCEAQKNTGGISAVLACLRGTFVAITGAGESTRWYYLAKLPRVVTANRDVLFIGP